MHALPQRLALAAVALLSLSCKDDREATRQSVDGVELEVYKRGAEPMRPPLGKEPPAWLSAKSMPTCPADVLPKSFNEPFFDPQLCAADRIDTCLEKCKNSDATACYSAAILLQETNGDVASNISTALYARACQLGDASGCTNWAASMDQNLESNQECLARTFEATCTRGEDPWGCTMYAHRLSPELSTRENLGKVRSLVAISCKWGEQDPACQTIRGLIAKLELSGGLHKDAAPQ